MMFELENIKIMAGAHNSVARIHYDDAGNSILFLNMGIIVGFDSSCIYLSTVITHEVLHVVLGTEIDENTSDQFDELDKGPILCTGNIS